VLPAGERPLASGPSSPSSAHEIVELVVLTADEHFLATMREAVGGATRLWHVSAPDKVSDLLLAGEVGILAVDGATLPGSNAGFIEQLKRQFPELVILFAGTREDETRLASLISNGAVYRFIHKPLSSARARLFVQAAVRKHEDPRSTMVLPAMIKPRRRPNLALIGGGAALALALLAGIGIWLGSRHATAPPPPATAGAEDMQLRQAAEALAANRLIAPPGDNALELYLARLARAPNDATARAGLAEVHERLLARAENALLEERLDDVAAAIEDARRSGVESGRIAFLSAQLAKARNQPKAAAPRPRPAVVETRRDEGLAQILRSAAERLDQGRLLDPDADSALFYLRRAVAIDPADLGVQQTRRALAARLLLDARTAMQARDFDKSNRLLQAAAGVAAQSDIDAARAALTAIRSETQGDRTRLPAATAQPERTPASTAASSAAPQPERAPSSAGTSGNATASLPSPGAAGSGRNPAATSPAGAAPEVVGVTALTRVSGKPVDYPAEAARQGLEGWVDIEFTVDTSGKVREPIVRNAQPAGMFDQAAIRAVQTWRFKPVMREGQPVEQRARIRLRFSLKN